MLCLLGEVVLERRLDLRGLGLDDGCVQPVSSPAARPRDALGSRRALHGAQVRISPLDALKPAGVQNGATLR